MCRRRPRVLEPALVDVEERHRHAPRSLSVPRSVVRRSLVVGDLVKLWFVVDPPVGSVEVERMWVEVQKAGEVGYVGRLGNDPGYARNLKADDRVRFRPEHVAARWAGEADPLYVDPNGFAVVRSRVWADDAWPRRVDRRQMPDPQLSGWFVSGLEGPVGTTMKWDDEAVEFVAVGAGSG